MRTLHVVLPNDIDDPRTPSGGNVYDRRVCRGLAELGWTVQEHAVHGRWPHPGSAERTALTRVLSQLPGDGVVLLDGLIASTVPDALTAEAGRLRLAVLVHMPLGDRTERAALATARAILTPSHWARRRLLELHALPADRIHVAAPGVDPAPLAAGSPTGERLLCVAAVAPHKGHDVLAQALADLGDLSWRCVCVGSLDREPRFAAALADADPRLEFVGPRTGAALAATYAAADLLVLPSRGETYAMVLTEALARGIPVLATDVGGVSEAVGGDGDGSAPGLLVPPEDPAALTTELRRWLGEPALRAELRRRAAARRTTLAGWDLTAAIVSSVLQDVAA